MKNPIESHASAIGAVALLALIALPFSPVLSGAILLLWWPLSVLLSLVGWVLLAVIAGVYSIFGASKNGRD